MLQVPPALGELAGLRRRVRSWSALAGLAVDTVTDLQLALGEAVTNAVEHAHLDRPAAAVRVEIAADPDGAVQVRVADTGRWRPPADPGFRGWGLSMIRRLAADLVVESGDRGTVVTLGIRPGPADGAAVDPVSRPAPSPGPALRCGEHRLTVVTSTHSPARRMIALAGLDVSLREGGAGR